MIPTFDTCMAEVNARRVTYRESDDGHFCIFNYAPEVEIKNYWNDANVWCRGLIFDRADTSAPVAIPFRKFWNVGQKPHTRLEVLAEKGMPVAVQDKLDGCCDGDTIVITEEGPMTIRDICETGYSGNVLSHDTVIGVDEWQPVISRSILNEVNDWYNIELEDGTILRLTGNHLMWCADLRAYRRVDELTGDEVLLKKT